MRLPRLAPVERFNRLCAAFAALWLLVTVPLGIMHRPTIPDFEQFYMGGVIASRGDWHALYPVPRPGSLDNPGLRIHSEAKPLWKSLSRELRVWDHTHFMLPPPSALLFVPLAPLTYSQAFWVFTFVLAACVWALALVAARLARSITGRSSRAEGALILLIALSPMSARAIRIANLSPPIALATGLLLLALVRRGRPASVAAGLVTGALLKYATLVLVPLLVVMRQWRALAYVGLFGALATGVTVLVAGAEPFIEYWREIFPTLSRPSAFLGNQTLPGLLVRAFGRPLAPEIELALNAARLFTLGCILAVLFTMRQRAWREPVTVLAAAALLLGWLLVFSPIAWEHWPLLMAPAWPWLLWEMGQPVRHARAVALVALALVCVPAGIFEVRGFAATGLRLPEPLNSTQLLGTALLAALAFRRLGLVRQRLGAPQPLSWARLAVPSLRPGPDARRLRDIRRPD